jgi:hypothetical protein
MPRTARRGRPFALLAYGTNGKGGGALGHTLHPS